jgi:hypothetical protein
VYVRVCECLRLYCVSQKKGASLEITLLKDSQVLLNRHLYLAMGGPIRKFRARFGRTVPSVYVRAYVFSPDGVFGWARAW